MREYPGQTPQQALMSMMHAPSTKEDGASSEVIEVQNTQAHSKITPHTPEAGDQYYIGDCYHRADIAQEWELDTANMPYLTHIKALSDAWKPLRHLADWMEVGTSPLRWLDVRIKPAQRKERAMRTNVTLLEYSSTGKLREANLRDASALKEALDSNPGDITETPALRLFLVEDLSRHVIESLGSRFDVDPLFFRDQIADYNWYNTRDSWAMAPNLMVGRRHQQWFRMRHIRFRYMDDQESYQKARYEANGFNVFRRPDDDETHWSYLDKKGSLIAATRTKTSIWVGKDPQNRNQKIGIVLIDPTVKQGYPLWGGPVNWMVPPGMTEDRATEGPAPDALYDLIIQATSSYPWFSSLSARNPISEQIIALPTLYTICAEWHVVCEYLKARLAQIDWELEKPSVFRSRGDMIEDSLRRLHIWRRLMPVFREMVSETLDHALPAAKRLTAPPQGEDNPLDDIRPDFKHVSAKLDELQERVDRLTAVVASEISTEDSRRGLQENHNLAKLTWLATTFIPLSFVTGFFSMTGDIAGLKSTYGWYFVTAIPLTLIVMVIAGGVGRGWFAKLKPRRTGSKTEK